MWSVSRCPAERVLPVLFTASMRVGLLNIAQEIPVEFSSSREHEVLAQILPLHTMASGMERISIRKLVRVGTCSLRQTGVWYVRALFSCRFTQSMACVLCHLAT